MKTGEQERHRTGESTFFDDVLYNIIFKDIVDVRICTLKLYTREWETVRNEVFYFLHLPSPHCRLLAQDTDPECLGFATRFPAHPK